MKTLTPALPPPGLLLGVGLGRTLWQVAADRMPLCGHPPQALWAVPTIGPPAILIANAPVAWPGHPAARCASATCCGRSEPWL